MTDVPRRPHENETEVVPVVVPRTAELPVVEEGTTEPAAPAAPPAAAPPPAAPAAPPPVAAAPPPAATAPPPPTAAPVVAAASSRPSARPRRPGAVVAVVALLVVAGLVAGGVAVLRSRSAPGPAAARGPATAATPAVLPATVTSFDPSGGSGLRREGARTWRTQTYRSADFGNLKSGVGLLLDLGAPRAVDTVAVQVRGGPVTLELRAADDRAGSESGYARVAGARAASGATTLEVPDGTERRYWLLWVTRLAPQDGGYRAVLDEPVVRGTR